MEQQKIKFGESFKTIGDYVKSQLELIKLKAVASGSRILGSVILFLTIFIFALFIIFYWSLSLGFYFSHLLDNNYTLGFLLAGFAFLLLIILILLLRKPLSGFIMSSMIRSLLKDWHEGGPRDEETDVEFDNEKTASKFGSERFKEAAVEEVQKLEEDIDEFKSTK